MTVSCDQVLVFFSTQILQMLCCFISTLVTPGRLNFKKHSSDKIKISYENSPKHLKLEKLYEIMLKHSIMFDKILEIQMQKNPKKPLSSFRI